MEKYLAEGVRFLARQQQSDGGFLTLSSQQAENFDQATGCRTTFSSSLILSGLCQLPQGTPLLQGVKDRLAAFLLTQRSEHWSFNYWLRGSPEAVERPYPDDLDDTFCALAALSRCRPALIGADAWANIVTLLTTVEAAEGGPYRTWLVPPTADARWCDVDLAVNSNVAYFLSLHDISLPGLQAFIEAALGAQTYTSRYYPSVYPVLYFLSRVYRGSSVVRLREFLRAQQNADGTWGNSLNTALACVALLNLHAPPETCADAIAALLQKRRGGTWAPSAFCLDPATEGRPYYSGSSALTTVFCLEAIAQYELLRTSRRKHGAQAPPTMRAPERERLSADILATVRERLSSLTGDLQAQAVTAAENILSPGEKRELALLPSDFYASLRLEKKTVPSALLSDLGAATVYGWIAYTIYDDFLDREGTPSLLPVANVCLRELTSVFERVLPDIPAWRRLFHRVLDTLEAANAWEARHCWLSPQERPTEKGQPPAAFLVRLVSLPEYPDLRKLAERSLGHALGPLAVLFALGYNERSAPVRHTLRFFSNYLTARQLNDDAHDWEHDLAAGHVNPVGAFLLRRSLSAQEVSDVALTSDLLAKLRELFWREGVREICEDVLRHVQQAKDDLGALSILSTTETLRHLLAPVEDAARAAIREHAQTVNFLRAYAQGAPKISASP